MPEITKNNSLLRIQNTKSSQNLKNSADRVLFLQRTVGNQAVQQLIKSGALQAKLRIGQPGDVYEQEADRVADAVMRMPEPGVQRQVEEEEEEETLQTNTLANQITPLVQVQRQEETEEEEEMLQAKSLVEEIEERIKKEETEVKQACGVCRRQEEIPDIIKRMAPNILEIHTQRVEQFKPVTPKMNLLIAYPRIKEKPLMSDVPEKGKIEFEYIEVEVALPFTINRPDAPITFLGHSGTGGYVVKSRHAILKVRCEIEDPVIFTISSAEHKKNLRPLATQYQKVFDQFKSLGQQAQIQRQIGEKEKEEDGELIQPKTLSEQITPLIQKQVEPEEEEILQEKDVSGKTPKVTPDLETRIQSLKSGGQTLPKSVRTFFEPRFGRDFSRVRVHTDAKAAESARAVNARAFTVGRDVVFGAGEYAPESSTGQRLMAHELTHVVQQSGKNKTHNKESSQ